MLAVYAGGQLTGTAESDDPALPVSADSTCQRRARSGFTRAQNLDLGALAPYGLGASGRPDLDATGELGSKQIAARFEARIHALNVAPVRVQSANVRGQVQGSTGALGQLAVEVDAEGTRPPRWARPSFRSGPSRRRARCSNKQSPFGRGSKPTQR